MQPQLTPKRLLVIAKSARMLVQMCVDSGCEVVAIDCFADSDTRQMALHTCQVGSLAVDEVRSVVDSVQRIFGISEMVYGSGLEHHPETLIYLEQHWRIFGNSAASFQRVQGKREFFSQLAYLSILYPETAFTQPEDSGDWLIKPWRGEGGIGIVRYNLGMSHEGYWQRFVEGESISVLFAAGVDQIEIIGFNRQWSVELDPTQAFVFAGITSHAELSDVLKRRLADYAQKLSKVYGLRGLNSLDCIVNEQGCYVLELNARISASAQLYGKGMLLKHLHACYGQLGNGEEISKYPRAYQIVYARKPVAISSLVDWPDWVVDRPFPGANVDEGQPICSIIAAGKNSQQVLEELHRQRLIVENILEIGT